VPFQELRNPSETEKYMADQLSEGTTLARLVLRGIDFALGKFRVAMPEMVKQAPLLDFRSGNVHLAGDEEEMFASVINSFIREPNSALLIQDSEASISDPWLQSFPHREFAIPYRGELYWRIAGATLANLSEDQMLEAINGASYFPWLGFFYFNGVPQTKTMLTGADLEHVASNLVGVAAGALDYRSFLVWWRDDLRAFPNVPKPDN
jgi:hypothetical protein